MPNIGTKGVFHTVKGDALAFVIDSDFSGANPDDDLQLIVFASSQVSGSETGLEIGENIRPSHVDSQAGGFTPAGRK